MVFIMAIALSSCSAFYIGTTTGGASISSRNFKMVGMATGTASVRSILGIGGMGKEALVLEAKKNLLQNNPIKEGQVIANVTVDFKSSSVLIVNTQKVTVSADIIEFTKSSTRKSVPMEKKATESPANKVKSTPQPIEKVPVPKTTKTETENTSAPKATMNNTEIAPTPKATQGDAEKKQDPQVTNVGQQSKSTPQPTPVSSIEPTILYSQPSEIITSSGERFKGEAGDYFIGTLDSNGNPENGKLYDKKGHPKHVILPKRNH